MDDALGPAVAARVRTARPYDPVSSLQAIAGARSTTHYKLDWNESTIEPSPKVFAALRRMLDGRHPIHWYPELQNEELHTKISDYAGCRPANVLLTNGSDDALALICRTYIDGGDEVVAPFPTYRHFLQFAELAGAVLRRIRNGCPFGLTGEQLEAAITPRTKMIYLANPNNPTGTLVAPAEIVRLAERHSRVLFLIDEAYYEFCGCSCAGSAPLLPNVVVTRSFSKCFCLAGLRLGFAIAAEPVLTALRCVHNPKSINLMAQAAAAAALDDLPYYRRYVEAVRESAEMVQAFCARSGIDCRRTHANFVLIRVDDPRRVAALLREAGVHVRDRSAQLPGMIRITLGMPAQMQNVLRRLGRVITTVREAPAGTAGANALRRVSLDGAAGSGA